MKKTTVSRWLLATILSVYCITITTAGNAQARINTVFDKEWKFYKGCGVGRRPKPKGLTSNELIMGVK